MPGLEARILKLENAAGPAQPPIASLSDDELATLVVKELVARGFTKSDAEDVAWELLDGNALIEAAGLELLKTRETH